MAVAISEQIIDKVRQRLVGIKISNGYEVTASEVIRPTRLGGFRPKHLQLVVTLGGIDRNDALSVPGNPPATAHDMTVYIAGLLMPTEESADKIDALRATFAADVIKAVATPQASWHNWDGLAIDTVVGNVDDVTTEEASGFKVTMTVTFRTTENNPYTSRS